jgi:hypothetical protein
MSFGFEDTEEVIKDAINCVPASTIMFAAAANHGGNKVGIAFPASMASVISIKSAKGDGTDSGFNPSSDSGAGDDFSTLGEAVLSMWRVSDEENGLRIFQKRQSGSSVATPIAAGIAALVLEFLWQPDEPDWDRKYLSKSNERLKLLNRREGMQLLFKNGLSTRHGRCRYVYPWKIIQYKQGLRERFDAASDIYRSLHPE